MSSSQQQDPTSTGQSYVDQAKGMAQSVLGSVTGSTADQNEAESRKQTAAAESDLSHSAAKAGPYTVTTQGGVAKDSPDRQQGSWNQTVGAAKESLGGLVGSESLRAAGERQNREGKEQEAKGQLSDLGEGVMGRAKGAVGGKLAETLGDERAREEFERSHDDAKARQRGVEAELQRKGEANA